MKANQSHTGIKWKCTGIMTWILLPLWSAAQTFALTDSTFTENDVYLSRAMFWDLGKTTLNPKSFVLLDSIADFLKKNDHVLLEVGVHYDGRTADREQYMSRKLSGSRARSIVDYFVDQGIPKERLSPKGYGSTKPMYVEDLDTVMEREEAYAKNRRVEFKIIRSK